MPMFNYVGPVMDGFGNCLNDRWRASTNAPSMSKAKSNLTYQYKSANNLAPHAKVTLPGKIVEVVHYGRS